MQWLGQGLLFDILVISLHALDKKLERIFWKFFLQQVIITAVTNTENMYYLAFFLVKNVQAKVV